MFKFLFHPYLMLPVVFFRILLFPSVSLCVAFENSTRFFSDRFQRGAKNLWCIFSKLFRLPRDAVNICSSFGGRQVWETDSEEWKRNKPIHISSQLDYYYYCVCLCIDCIKYLQKLKWVGLPSLLAGINCLRETAKYLNIKYYIYLRPVSLLCRNKSKYSRGRMDSSSFKAFINEINK